METEIVTAGTQVLIHEMAQYALLTVIAAFVVEKSLGFLFTWRWYEAKLSGKGWKKPIAFTVCYIVAHNAGTPMDAMVLFGASQPTILGAALTAGLIAGGSQALATKWGNLAKTIKDTQKSISG